MDTYFSNPPFVGFPSLALDFGRSGNASKKFSRLLEWLGKVYRRKANRVDSLVLFTPFRPPFIGIPQLIIWDSVDWRRSPWCQWSKLQLGLSWTTPHHFLSLFFFFISVTLLFTFSSVLYLLTFILAWLPLPSLPSQISLNFWIFIFNFFYVRLFGNNRNGRQ